MIRWKIFGGNTTAASGERLMTRYRHSGLHKQVLLFIKYIVNAFLECRHNVSIFREATGRVQVDVMTKLHSRHLVQ